MANSVVEWPTSEELTERFVTPWYLKMMRRNACEHGGELAPAIARVSIQADNDVVLRLLRLGWRERVMGAWLSVTRDSEPVVTEVLRWIEGSHGSLDAPPLATAGVVLAGPDCMDALVAYYEADLASDWGAADVIQEAANYLEGHFNVPNPLPQPPNGSRRTFEALVGVAEAIRS